MILKSIVTILALTFVTCLSAATITVNTTDDSIENDSDCSLREAVTAANTNAAFMGCSAGQASPTDVIELQGLAYNLSLGSSGDDINEGGDLDITESVIIQGATAIDASIFSDFMPLDGNGSGGRAPLTDFAQQTDGIPEPNDPDQLKANILGAVEADLNTALQGQTVIANAIGDMGVDGDGDRVIHADPLGIGGVDITLRNLAIMNGDVGCTGDGCRTGGGGIETYDGMLTIENSVVALNTVSCQGTNCGATSDTRNDGAGAIQVNSNGGLSITNSSLMGNRAECRDDQCGVGSGVLNMHQTNQDVTIQGSVIAGNIVLCVGSDCVINEMLHTDDSNLDSSGGNWDFDTSSVIHNMMFCVGLKCDISEFLEGNSFESQDWDQLEISWNLLECYDDGNVSDIGCNFGALIDGSASSDATEDFSVADISLKQNVLICHGVECRSSQIIDEAWGIADRITLDSNLSACSGDDCKISDMYDVGSGGRVGSIRHTDITATNNRLLCKGDGCDSALLMELNGDGSIYNRFIVRNNLSQCDGDYCTAEEAGIYFESINQALLKSQIIGNRSLCEGSGCAVSACDASADGETTCPVSAGGAVRTKLTGITIADTLIQGNESSGSGAGLVVIGTTTLTRTTIRDNISALGGGGIDLSGDRDEETGEVTEAATLTIIDSSIINNHSGGNGGGILARNLSTLNISNSTLSGNSADTTSGQGGGIYSEGATLNMNNATIAQNAAVTGGGLTAQTPTQVSITNSIIADALSGEDCVALDSATVTLDDGTIIEDGSCGAITSGDPGLLDLDNNGGTTPSHALKSTSIARDAGDVSTCENDDQRDQLRDDGDAQCDVGAIEFNPSDGSSFFVIPIPGGGAAVTPL